MTDSTLEALIRILNSGRALTKLEATNAAKQLIAPATTESLKKTFLKALSAKGETAEELAAFAGFFRQLAHNPKVDAFAPHALDVCGTGGDGAGSFNISTAVSFIVAAAGVPVFKHGNRRLTSSCGSADLLSALGFPMEMKSVQWRQSLQALHFAFFFAPVYHPAFAQIAPVRKALAAEGTRTIFNLLGPILNPGRPAYQLLGVFDRKWVDPIAEALHQLGIKRGLVVHSVLPDGSRMDELACAGDLYVAGVGELRKVRGSWSLADFGLEEGDPADLRGGNVASNLQLLEALLDGNAPNGLAAAISINAGTALWVANAVDTPAEGAARARNLLRKGTVAAWLNKAQGFFKNIANAKQEKNDDSV